MASISLDKWRSRWAEYIDPPDERDREREETFLKEHAAYGARVHTETAEVLAATITVVSDVERRHTLFLRLFAEFVNALEVLGAWGWTFQHRTRVRSFLDGFLSYPFDAPEVFYKSALATDRGLVELLDLPPREQVIRAARDLVQEATARQVGEWLDDGLRGVRESASQYFTREAVIVTHYNKAKHGTTMVRLPKYTNDEFDFQVIAPQRNEAEIAKKNWYDIAQFRADDQLTERLRKNTHVVGQRIEQMANLAWILYRSDLLNTIETTTE